MAKRRKHKRKKSLYCVMKGKRKVSCHRLKASAKRARKVHGGRVVKRSARRRHAKR